MVTMLVYSNLFTLFNGLFFLLGIGFMVFSSVEFKEFIPESYCWKILDMLSFYKRKEGRRNSVFSTDIPISILDLLSF